MKNQQPMSVKQCRVCGHLGMATCHLAREMMYGTREEFLYFQCSECGCLQIDEIPMDLERHYPKNYYSLSSNGDLHHNATGFRQKLIELLLGPEAFGRGYKLSAIAGFFVQRPPSFGEVARLLKHLPSVHKQLRFLDVGCGSTSWWLSGLRAAGFSYLTGLDPNISDSRELSGIKILRGSIENMEGAFDVISLHHSLEHIADQSRTLTEVKRLLTPNGICIVRIPLVDSDAWQRYGTNWVELDAPRHLYLHSERSFLKIANAVGLEAFTKYREGSDFEYWGSEQYEAGVYLTAPQSYWQDRNCGRFSDAEISRFRAMADEANRAGRGGRGAFFLHST